MATEKRISKWYEIAKYQPQYYKNHVYTQNEWVCFDDIGQCFNGKLLGRDEYIRVEEHYCQAAIEILKKSNCKYVTIEYLVKTSPSDMKKYIKENSEFDSEIIHALDNMRSLREGQRFLITEIPWIMRLALRNFITVIFENKAKLCTLSLESTYYYMGIRTPIEKSKVRTIVERYGLYLDPR